MRKNSLSHIDLWWKQLGALTFNQVWTQYAQSWYGRSATEALYWYTINELFGSHITSFNSFNIFLIYADFLCNVDTILKTERWNLLYLYCITRWLRQRPEPILALCGRLHVKNLNCYISWNTTSMVFYP